ncbi:MAG: TetR/AcrR family transcriptional regulator C-terminal domain-containing protein [Nisaea sp.]|uniref:TetR/AcrR family transcriptional regulator n=1 Tax=Nisaea sp. TaxID=2024842 RepID=UPI001B24B061|nr:TetR/AcrR family transcriptional regulator C-terminal domain-containing protein [Nisaea sp.]MBO6561304.1 TetR/AcrR family transcriptional regulator C-terminal domain-containing protein [Nisaea sp.]
MAAERKTGNSGALGRKRKSTPLSSETIVAAAIDLLDREGLDNFSIRNIAKALGVYPTALYWHVPSRHLLIARVIAALFADVLPKENPDWRVWLKELFRRYRDIVRMHPNVAPLVGGHLVSSASVDLKLVEAILSTLAGAGFEGERLLAAYNSIIAGMCGYATQEFAHVFPDPEGELETSLTASVEAADPALYPTLAAERRRLLNRALILRWQNGNQASLESGFEMFTDALIAGLEIQLDRS